jgi:hypothetical protein
MKAVALLLITAPLGYLALSAYLLGKVRPVPVALLSSALGQEEPEIETLAA